MNKKSKQKLHLRLEGRTLLVGRLTKDEGVGQWSEWKIRKESFLPRGLFFLVSGYVIHRVKKIPKEEKCFETLKEAIRRGLCEAAVACGCTWKVGGTLSDVRWLLDGKRFFAFQIVDFHKHADTKRQVLQQQLRERRAFDRMEEKSGGMLRGALVVLKGGLVRFAPGKTRSD